MKAILFLFVLVTSVSFGQDKIFEAKVANPTHFNESKNAGEFKFILPNATKKEDVNRAAEFYKTYFTVSYDENQHIASVKMLVNDSKSRQIINRFMISLKITQIEMGGVLYKVEEFYQKQLK